MFHSKPAIANSNGLLPNHPFWQFSCKIYESTQDALLRMQSRHGLNVNIILFCYWFSANYMKILSKNDIQKIFTATHAWHENTIHPLRNLRNSLKTHKDLDWVNVLREEVLKAELEAEKIEQLLIVDLFSKEKHHIEYPTAQKAVMFAFRSIRLYCEMHHTDLDKHDCADLFEIAYTIFPNVKKENITTWGYKILRRTITA